MDPRTDAATDSETEAATVTATSAPALTDVDAQPAERVDDGNSADRTDHGAPAAVAGPMAGRPSSPAPTVRAPLDVSDDDRDVGWSERPSTSGRDDEWYLEQRPPHHG